MCCEFRVSEVRLKLKIITFAKDERTSVLMDRYKVLFPKVELRYWDDKDSCRRSHTGHAVSINCSTATPIDRETAHRLYHIRRGIKSRFAWIFGQRCT